MEHTYVGTDNSHEVKRSCRTCEIFNCLLVLIHNKQKSKCLQSIIEKCFEKSPSLPSSVPLPPIIQEEMLASLPSAQLRFGG